MAVQVVSGDVSTDPTTRRITSCSQIDPRGACASAMNALARTLVASEPSILCIDRTEDSWHFVLDGCDGIELIVTFHHSERPRYDSLSKANVPVSDEAAALLKAVVDWAFQCGEVKDAAREKRHHVINSREQVGPDCVVFSILTRENTPGVDPVSYWVTFKVRDAVDQACLAATAAG